MVVHAGTWPTVRRKSCTFAARHYCTTVVLVLGFGIAVMVAQMQTASAMHGHAYVRKTAHQHSRMEEEELEEEEMDEDEANDEYNTAERQIVEILNQHMPMEDDSVDGGGALLPPESGVESEQRHADKDKAVDLNKLSDGGGRFFQQIQLDRNAAHSVNALDKESVFEQGETRDFLQFLRRIQYDHRQCPYNEADEPVVVLVSVVVSNVRAVSEVTMDYSLEMFYRESWLDPRLVYDKKKFKNKTELALHESYANFLWHPDTFMPNAIASKNPRKQSVSHRSLLRLQSDGNVLYSRRLSVVAECPMDLTLFPFDSQVCKLGIESYGYTADQVRYGWSQGQREALKLQKIRLPDFHIKEAYVTNQLESYATGNYSRLYICFIFTRSAGFCFLQLIIPSTAVVITSWVSMWMENETSFQDMISIILTILLLTFSYNEVMPRVSYLKALDIWLAVCFMVVFLSLIKLALIKYMKQRLQITQDTSIVADMIPLVRIAAANGIALAKPTLGVGGFTAASPPPLSQIPTPQQQNQILKRRQSLRYSQQSSVTQLPPQPPQSSRSKTPSPFVQQRTTRRVSRLSNALDDYERKRSALDEADREQRVDVATASTAAAAINSYVPPPLTVPPSRAVPSLAFSGFPPTTAGSGGFVVPSLLMSQMSSGIGQIIAHQALCRQQQQYQQQQQQQQSSSGRFQSYGGCDPTSTNLSTTIIRQLQQQQAQQQHDLQARIQTQLMQAQAQLYLRRQQEKQQQLQKKNQQRHRSQRRQRKRSSLFEYKSQQQNENNNNNCELGIVGGGNNSSGGWRKKRSECFDTSVDDLFDDMMPQNRLLMFLDNIGNMEFSAQFLNRFHWISQMTFFFGFVLFCFFFFLVYPNIRIPVMDPACMRESAEWFAEI